MHGFDELGEVHRFANVAVATIGIACGEIALLERGCEDDNREQSRSLVGTYSFEYFETFDLGEFQVEEDYLGQIVLVASRSEEVFKRLDAITSNDDLVLDVVFLQ